MDIGDWIMKFGLYNGPLDPKKMTAIARKGYNSYTNQKSKCENKNNPDYKYYGAKNILVCYSRREFIAWWISANKENKVDDPTTGRIDHNKNYCFENIIVQERSANSKERTDRLGAFLNKKPIISFINNKIDKVFDSASEAANYYGINVSTVIRLSQDRYLSGKIMKKSMNNGLSFKYKKEMKL